MLRKNTTSIIVIIILFISIGYFLIKNNIISLPSLSNISFNLSNIEKNNGNQISDESITVTKENLLDTEGASSFKQFEDDVIDSTNRERLQAGLEPLKVQNLLYTSAHVKAFDMLTNQYFEHISPSGKGVSDLSKESGYDYLVIGENLALGEFDTADAVVKAWMNSSGHRANILNKNYSEIGVAMIRGTYENKPALFVVQHFGTPRSICPAISATLKKDIDEKNAALAQDEKTILTLKGEIEANKNLFSPEYISLVNKFNSLVEKYNTTLTESKALIANYNEQVRLFNNCLSSYQ